MNWAEVDDEELPPAARLAGRSLESGWEVIKRIERLDGQTGSFFSIGYLAKNAENGAIAFLKALDFSKALQEDDLLRAIQQAVGAFQFEQELLSFCADRKMTRVVTALDSGYVKVDESQLGRVPYLLFEPAEGDLRKALTGFGNVQLGWALAILHEVALGLEQLHYAQVAHQDIKPSNILTFDSASKFKVSDLGCASRKGFSCPRDDRRVPGAWSVAPPELIYGEKSTDWVVSRVAADIYSLGSLAVFLFTGASMNAIVKRHIPVEYDYIEWRGTYREALPFVVNAYSSAFDEMADCFEGDIPSAVFLIVKQLCDPDPFRRGDPRYIGRANEQYDVRKYVSRFGNLRRKAEISSKKVLR